MKNSHLKRKIVKQIGMGCLIGVLLSFCKGTEGSVLLQEQATAQAAQENITISKTRLTARVGNTAALKVYGTKEKVTWKSSKPWIVRVSEKGVLTMRKPGKATITATIGTETRRCVVTVAKPVITLPTQMYSGETGQVSLGGKKYKKLSFASSQPEVLEVDENGMLTAKGAGKAKITVRIANYSYSVNVEVSESNTLQRAVISGNLSGLAEEEVSLAKKAHEIYVGVIEPGMTDIEKIRAIHDYIVLHTEYAYEEYVTGTVYQKDELFRAEGALLDGRSVCQGYAEAMKLFLDAMEIENELIVGEGKEDVWISHAWNLICLDGEWYHLDATLDDPVMNGKDSGHVFYTYFMVKDASVEDDHRWNRADYPKAYGEKYSTYMEEVKRKEFQEKGAFLNSAEEYPDAVVKHFEAGEQEISLLYPGKEKVDTQTALRMVAEKNAGRRCGIYYFYSDIGMYTVITTSFTIE